MVDSISSYPCKQEHNPFTRSAFSLDKTQVMRYDDGPLVVLDKLADLEDYIRQNSSSDIARKRQVRLLLRALENQSVVWPYDHVVVRKIIP